MPRPGVLGGPLAVGAGEFTIDHATHRYPGDAAMAPVQLDSVYAGWMAGVRSLGAARLARPCGPAGGRWASAAMAGLVFRINRQMLHHGAEIAPLRDLYLRTYGT